MVILGIKSRIMLLCCKFIPAGRRCKEKVWREIAKEASTNIQGFFFPYQFLLQRFISSIAILFDNICVCVKCTYF